ncbi:MAG: Unknown protein [uncultured Sulfurovum sp.]|uniref:DUF4139 domain-containing protein n=1 Tax=uncultured Sulfurovum sp. TaxID=269237 RepID=A0A6S6T2T0_9BACT|nr:MAG: Unknown protein [uncultured Sulfurovum sp.]
MHKIIYSSLLLSTFVLANVVVPSTGSDLKITIYNKSKAFIHDTREVTLQAGKQKLVYEGVPSSVITESVVPTFTGLATKLYSQNYIYDLISLKSMLAKSINQEVSFYSNEKEPTLNKGILLSSTPKVMIKEKRTGKIFSLNSATQVIFEKVPKNMITKPSLIWNMEAKVGGKMGIDLKYLAGAISWKSDYVVNMKKDTLDLKGWITVKNDSGVAYENAQITCLAGDINMMPEPSRYRENLVYGASMPTAMMERNLVKEESFSGYHIYKIPFRETIANKEQKQISFIAQNEVKYQQYGQYINNYFEKGAEQQLQFSNIIEFENKKENNMGMALPSGVMRMYQKDSSGETHFIGESRVENIPEDENVTLTVGTLFDAVGEKIVSKYVAKKHHKNVETTYTVRNQGKEPLLLRLEENIPVYGNDISLKTSCQDNCSVKKKSAFVREFSIKLAPKEKYRFTSEFEVNY